MLLICLFVVYVCYLLFIVVLCWFPSSDLFKMSSSHSVRTSTLRSYLSIHLSIYICIYIYIYIYIYTHVYI